MIVLHRKFGTHELKCYLNFAETSTGLPPEEGSEPWELLLDSAAPIYGGDASTSAKLISASSAQIYYRKNCPSTHHEHEKLIINLQNTVQ
jgi:hypothetical protein